MKHNFAYYIRLLLLTTILLLLTGCGNAGTHANTLSVSGVNPDSSEPLTLEMFKEDATPYLGRTLEDIQEALGDAIEAPKADEDPHNYWVNVGVNLCFNDAYRCIGMATYADAMPLLSGMLNLSEDEAYDALTSAGFTCSDEYENLNNVSIVPRLALDEGKYGIVATSDNYCYMVRDIDKKAQPKAALSWLERGTYCPQDMQKLDLADWIGISHEECRDKYHVDSNDWLDYINGGGIITVGFTSEDDDGLIFDLSAYSRDFSFLGVPLSLEPKELCAELQKIKGVSVKYSDCHNYSDYDNVTGTNGVLQWDIYYHDSDENQFECDVDALFPELLDGNSTHESLTEQTINLEDYYTYTLGTIYSETQWASIEEVFEEDNTINTPQGYWVTLAGFDAENGEWPESEGTFAYAVSHNVPFTDSMGNTWHPGDPLPNPGAYYNGIPIINMQAMFAYCGASTLNLSLWNTENVKLMSGMFAECCAESIDLSSFDTAQVNTMRLMFEGDTLSALDLSYFDTSSVTDMRSMFEGATLSALDLSHFDTSNVTDMRSMFENATIESEKLDLSTFDFSNDAHTSYMFAYIYVGEIYVGSDTQSTILHRDCDLSNSIQVIVK